MGQYPMRTDLFLLNYIETMKTVQGQCRFEHALVRMGNKETRLPGGSDAVCYWNYAVIHT